jgi:hypothetical protein
VHGVNFLTSSSKAASFSSSLMYFFPNFNSLHNKRIAHCMQFKSSHFISKEIGQYLVYILHEYFFFTSLSRAVFLKPTEPLSLGL